MTYNILDGGLGRESHIADVLQSVQPDVVVLQELFQPDLASSLASKFGMKYFFAAGNSIRHMALLSRLPITACRSYHPFPPIHRTLLEAEIEFMPGQSVYVFGVHLMAHYSLLLEAWRWWEIKVILQYIESKNANPCVMVGDFNTIAPQDQVVTRTMPLSLRLMLGLQGGHVFRFTIRQVLSAGWADCFRYLHPAEHGFTLPPPLPNARLDYIFANGAITPHLRRCFVVYEPSAVQQASDHYPVVAEFELQRSSHVNKEAN